MSCGEPDVSMIPWEVTQSEIITFDLELPNTNSNWESICTND